MRSRIKNFGAYFIMTAKHQEFLKTVCDSRFVKWKRLIIIIVSLSILIVSAVYALALFQGKTEANVNNLNSDMITIEEKIEKIDNMVNKIDNIDKNIIKLLDRHNDNNTGISVTK